MDVILFIVLNLTLLTLGYLGYRKAKDNFTNQTFFFSTITVVTWLVFNISQSLITNPRWIEILLRLDFFTAPFATYSLSIFFINVPVANKSFSKSKMFLWAIPALLMSLCSLGDFIIKDIKVSDGQASFNEGIAFILYSGVILLYLITGLANLYLRYRKTLHGREREQAKYIFIGCSGASIFAATFNLFLQPLVDSNIFRLVGNYISPFILATFVLYVIVAHRLMDIKIVLKKSTVFGGSMFTILFLSYLFQYSLRYILDPESNRSNVILGLLVVTFAVWIAPLLKNFYSILANKYFFTSLYDKDTLISDLSEKLGSTIYIDDLSGYISKSLKEAFRSKAVGILLKDKVGEDYHLLSNYGFNNIENRDTFPGDEQLRKIFIKKNKPIILEEVKSNGLYNGSKKVIDLLDTFHVDIVSPLNIGDEIVGLIVIGKKETEEMYNTEDLSVLKIIGSQAAIALKNALLYKEVKDFNKKLKLKVAEATKDLRRSNKKLEISNKQFEVANSELKKLDDTKSQFISMASHQLRTPISITRGYTSMMADGDFGELTEDQEIYLKKINDNLGRLNNIVNDILNASRLEGNRFAINKEMVDISQLVEDAFEQLRSKVNIKNLDYHFHVDPQIKTLKLNIDKEKMFEVISNLIDNAICYTKEGLVKVDVFSLDDNVVISVQDSGIGVPPDKKDTIFDRFTRLENAKAVRPDGTGIGLYLAKSIVEAHGGEIWVDSELGKGSTFFVKLSKKSDDSKDNSEEEQLMAEANETIEHS